MRSFKCDACGACCRNLHLSVLYSSLDRGDGVCRHLDEATSLCRIYADRPSLCRVEEQFLPLFSGSMTFEQYIEATTQACEELKRITPSSGKHVGSSDVSS